jgi:hypothetical protein
LAGILVIDIIANLLGWWTFALPLLLLAVLLGAALTADTLNFRWQHST